MAEIEIMPLSDRLSDDEVVELAAAMEELGAPRIPKATDDAAVTVAEGLDDEALAEFLDQLDAHDLACEIYMPMEFDGRAEVAGLRVGSAAVLLDVLEELKDELGIGADEEPDEDDDDLVDDDDLLAGKLKQIWKLFYDAAVTAMDRHLPMHVQS